MTHKWIKALAATQMAFLATCENLEPRLRPMTLICKGGKVYFATGAADGKSLQIAANPNAEFCSLYREGKYSGYLRGRGILRQIEAVERKKEIADFATFIYDYWKDPADPNYRLFELELRQLRYLKPGEMYEEIADL